MDMDNQQQESVPPSSPAPSPEQRPVQATQPASLGRRGLLAGALVCLLVGQLSGFLVGAGLFRSKQEPSSAIFDLESKAIVQRLLHIKGEISDIKERTLIVVPSDLTETEQAEDQLSISLQETSTIYLQTAADDLPQQVGLDELKIGDRVDVNLSLDETGVTRTTNITAYRE